MSDERAKDSRAVGPGQSGAGQLALGLATDQRSALEQLLVGKSVPESAQSAGVSRTTVYRWLKDDAAFRAAYNQWKDELEETARTRLLMLSDVATNALRTALEKGDGKLALATLKAMGLASPSKERLTEPADVKQRNELDKKKRRMDMEKEERQLHSDVKWDRFMDQALDKFVK
jgi:AcrR family transcriptional regulator